MDPVLPTGQRQPDVSRRVDRPRGRAAPPLLARPDRRSLVLSIARSMLTVVVLVVVYYLLPLNRAFGGRTIVLLIGGLLLLSVGVGLQLRAIVHSRFPALRAMESLALTVPGFLLMFAVVYEILSSTDPHSFSQPLSRTDALYFVVTVFATVGFGDITAVSEVARVLVTIQMIADLLLLGLVIRAVVRAVQSSGAIRSDGQGPGPG